MPTLLKKELIDKLTNILKEMKGSDIEITNELNTKPVIGTQRRNITAEELIPLIKDIDNTKIENNDLLWIVDKIKDADTIDIETIDKLLLDNKITKNVVDELKNSMYVDILGESWGETNSINTYDVTWGKDNSSTYADLKMSDNTILDDTEIVDDGTISSKICHHTSFLSLLYDIRNEQKSIKDDFEILNDSLKSMSKRQSAIQPFIVKESGKIYKHIDRVLSMLQEQNKGKAMAEQQYAMTSMNNLALMLAESLEQMKQSMQMSGNQKGGSKCKNPGKGKSPSMSEIMNQQKGLNEGLKGKSKKNGLDGKSGLNSKSEELARMAAAQGEIRRMLQEFIEQLEGEGGNGNALNKLTEEMKKTEDDIVNRRVSPETLERQKNIETRLLKSEKALQEREKEKKRESKEGKKRKSSNLNNKIEYKATKVKQEEILITIPLEVRPYYKSLLKEYLYKLENDKNDE